MKNHQTTLSPTLRFRSALALLLMAAAGLLCSAWIALGQEPAHPLQPPDRSSPRAALQTFLDAGAALSTFLARDYLPSPSRAEFQRLILLGDAAVQSLDLSEFPPATRVKSGRVAALSLYETLSRIQLPPASEIPTAD